MLVGGRSSRMGQPKAALDFGGMPLLTRIVIELKWWFDEIVIVAAPKSEGTAPHRNSRLEDRSRRDGIRRPARRAQARAERPRSWRRVCMLVRSAAVEFRRCGRFGRDARRLRRRHSGSRREASAAARGLSQAMRKRDRVARSRRREATDRQRQPQSTQERSAKTNSESSIRSSPVSST